MIRLVALVAPLAILFSSCGVPDMPLPPDHQYVSAADAGPGAPFTQVECPSDDAEISAEDIRRVCATLLANQMWALEDRELHYEYTSLPSSTPWMVDGPYGGNTWQETAVQLTVPDAKAGDDLLIRVWGNWELNSSSSPGDVVGKLRFSVAEDPTVPGPAVFYNPVGEAVIYDDAGSLALPHHEQYHLEVRHRVIDDSDVQVSIQARSQDLTGGAATGAIVLMFSARLDVTRVRRSML